MDPAVLVASGSPTDVERGSVIASKASDVVFASDLSFARRTISKASKASAGLTFCHFWSFARMVTRQWFIPVTERRRRMEQSLRATSHSLSRERNPVAATSSSARKER